MSDFDTELRAQLHRAADQAPTFSLAESEPRELARRAPGRAGQHGTNTRNAQRFPRPVLRRTAGLLAAAAVVPLAVGGLWWAAGPDDGTPEATSCPHQLTSGGRVYIANGDLTRLPRAGAMIAGVHATADSCGVTGRAAPTQGKRVAAHRISGVEPSVGFLAEGMVWTQAQFTRLPEQLGDYYAPVRCVNRGTLVGHLTGMNARVAQDYHPVAPYTATFMADDGPGLQLDRYSLVTLHVRVTPETVNGTDPSVLRTAMGGGHRTQVQVHCENGHFVADALELR